MIRQCLLTQNECYQKGRKHRVRGIMVHSTGANNPYLKRYLPPSDEEIGQNQYGNHWNQFRPDGRQVCVHAFIGKLQNGSVATYQTLPWDFVGWHSGSGSLGQSKNANNNGYVGFEICEDDLKDQGYFQAVYNEAVALCVYLCKEYDLDPLTQIIDHREGNRQGIASNHGDIGHWFSQYNKEMEDFRLAVLEQLDAMKQPPKKNPPTGAVA